MRNIVVPFFTFLLAILFVSPLAAQNCGCVEEENCPETIAPVSNFNVCYTFTDAFNNDLADPAQGVCGVNLAFTHDYIWDLEMTLISPNGTEVMLVGENTMGTGGTTFTSWDVQFVGCEMWPFLMEHLNLHGRMTKIGLSLARLVVRIILSLAVVWKILIVDLSMENGALR
jgi:hypothetical protein